MGDGEICAVSITYRLACGRKIPLEVHPEVAHYLEAERKRWQTQRRNDRRFLDFDGYVEGETELLLHDLGGGVQSVLDEVQERERNRIMNDAVSRLPPRQKCYVHAYYFKALTYEEIGRREGVAKQTVAELIQLALDKLKVILYRMSCFQAYLREVTE